MEDTNTMRRANSERDTPARRALAYREAFLDTVTAEDVRAIGAQLLERAKAGDLSAVKLVLDRVLGPASVENWPSQNEVAMNFLA
jgi:hypothetical protein